MAPSLTPPGVERSFGWVPTDDPGQIGGPSLAAIYQGGRAWTAAGFATMGHVVAVNLTTGALSISVTDRTAPYHAGSFSATRIYDAQEQFAQSDYLRTHPNTDPRPHFFGNWQLEQEAQVSATWDRAYAELLVGSGGMGGSLAYRSEPDFVVHAEDGAEVEQRLRAWGIPGRTLKVLGWHFQPGDLLLKSRQGGLFIVSGRYEAESLIDHVEAELWRFSPTTGAGEHYTSSYGYQQFIDVDGMRETNVPIVRSLATDALGHTIAFQPTAAEPPFRIWALEDGTGRRYRLDLEHYITYLDGNDPGNNAKAYVVTQLTDESSPQSAPIKYSYDDAGRLVAVDYPGQAGAALRRYTYAYDDRGALLSITDPVGDSLSFEYVEDDLDVDARLLPRLKLKRIVNGDGNQIEYTYDFTNNVTRAALTSAGGGTRGVKSEYLEDTADTRQRYIASQSVSVTLGPSAPQTITTGSVYSDDGRFLLIEAVDPLGSVTSYEFNDYNQMTAVVDALGHRRELTYDVTVQPTVAAPNRYDLVRTFETSFDVAGTPYNIQTGFDYARYDAVSSPDAADTVQSTHRMSAWTDVLGHTSRFAYDDHTDYFSLRASRFTDALGNVSARSYDDRGAVLSHTDTVGSNSQWEYDPLGRLLSSTDPNGNTRHWLYDPSTGWLVTATDALGTAGDPFHSVKYEWNDSGQRIRDTDAAGAKTEYAYYPGKRLRSVTQYDPVARVTIFTFDAVGNLTELTDPAGNVVFVRYDEANRVYELAHSNSASSIRFKRDLAGRVIEMTDRNGAAIKYQYDALARLVNFQEPDWPTSAPVNPGKQVGISYDPQGKRLRVTDTEAPGDYVYRYDPAGNLIERDNPDASKLLYEYDARDALVRLHDGVGAIDLRFTRDGDARLLSLADSAYLDPSLAFTYHRRSGALVDNLYRIDYGTPRLSTRFEYNPNRQLTLTEQSLSGATLASHGYHYRVDGLIGRQSGPRSVAYDYDDRKQLISEGPKTRAGYDAAGNRLWRAAAPPPAVNQAVFDTQNRMLSDDKGTKFDYDANGNMVRRTPVGGGPPTTFTYDAANRLRIVDDGSTIVRYTYDADGRMSERLSQRGTRTETRRYRYADKSILAELDGNGKIEILYTRDDNARLLRRRTKAALHPAPSQDPHSLFYLSDGLGSVVQMVDRDARSHLSREYDAWGEPTGSGSIGTFRYRGGYEDVHTRLVSFGARWYDPRIGRWLSQDPLLAVQAAANADMVPYYAEFANLYCYVLNNPLGRQDPSGLQGTQNAPQDSNSGSFAGPDYWSLSVSFGAYGLSIGASVAGSLRGPGIIFSPSVEIATPGPSVTLVAGFLHPPWEHKPATNEEVLSQLEGLCIIGQGAYRGVAGGVTYSPSSQHFSGEAGVGLPGAGGGVSYGYNVSAAYLGFITTLDNGIRDLYGLPRSFSQ
jgi:RHS repeat-associated protein